MSLINDMLRDLDARRQGRPRRGAGTEKLTPPRDDRSDRDTGGSQQRLVLGLVILLAAAAGGAVALYLAATGDRQPELPVAREPVMTQEQQPRQAANTPAEDADESSDARSSTAPADDGTATRAGDAMLPAPRIVEAREWEPRNWSSLEGSGRQEGESSDMASAPARARAPQDEGSREDSVGQVTRTPREPSFAERDRQQVQQALTLWSEGREQAALEALDQFTLDHPRAHRSREMLGKLLLQRGETDIALRVANIGLEVAPLHDGYRKLKARLLLAGNQPGEALRLLDDQTPAAEADAEYHELLATAALAAQDYELAQLSYNNLLRTDDSQGRWWYGLATALEARGQSGNAVRAYERARQSGTLTGRLRQRSAERIAQLGDS